MMRSTATLLALTLGPIAACASAPDRDGDGIRDAVDACPWDPEDWTDARDDGCPAPAPRPTPVGEAPVPPKPDAPLATPSGPAVNPYAASPEGAPPSGPTTPLPARIEVTLPTVPEAEARCDASGEALACVVAGSHHMGGSNPHAGARYFERGCDRGDPTSCTGLGRLAAMRGDLRTAAGHFERSCDRGEMMACGQLAALLEEGGAGVPRDRARARALATRACEGDDPEGCVVLAGLVWDRDADEATDPTPAIAPLERACRFESGEACLLLGDIRGGHHDTTDDDDDPLDASLKPKWAFSDLPAALRLYERACALGEALGCDRAADAHEHGRGTPRDPAAAAVWRQRGRTR